MSEVPTVDLPDERVAQYWLGGAAAGPVVMLFHGCPDSRWAASGGEDAARTVGVRLLCVNRPGYGRSTRAASTHRSVATDAVAVLDRLGLERVASLGMSVGGAYAAALAAHHPERVTTLGIVAALPEPAATGDGGTIEDAMAEAAPEFERYAATIDVDDPDDAALAARWAAALPDQDAALVGALPVAAVAAAAREALTDHHGYLRDAALAFRPWDLDVTRVRCPTYLWYGELDERALPGGGWFAERIPGARLVVRPGTTHWATLAAYWPDVLSTLARHLP